jgi:putative redox protein
MVEINIQYEGDLHTSAEHGPSGVALETDAPVDNNGRGESFSPTDLVATALGTCMLTTMGIYARRNEIDLRGAHAHVEKEMVQRPLRRIGQLSVKITVPLAPDHSHRKALEDAALKCPVRQSVHPDIAIPVEFSWEPALATQEP